jgi:hypothetical protein
MHGKAHVRLRAQARADIQLTGAHRARTGFTTTRPTGPGQLVVRWVQSPNGRLEMRWERRLAPPTRITPTRTRTRGEAAARHLDTCN